jgi:hypothetical protein
MGGELLWRQHFDVRRAIQQDSFILCLQPDAQHPRGLRHVAGIDHSPHAVKLIVAVQCQAIGKMGQQSFTPRFKLGNTLPDQLGLIRF